MFCQECGAQIRAQAKFCNRCGAVVRQRFGDIDNDPTVALPPPPLLSPPAPAPKSPPPSAPSAPPPGERQPLSRHAWPRAEEAIVMPVIEKSTSAGSPPPRPQLPTETGGNMVVRFDLMKPDTSDVEHAPSTGEINSGSALPQTVERAVERSAVAQRRNEEMKPFFTQVGDAVPNRQHKRLILVVPLLLLLAVFVFVFAYFAAR